MLMTVVKSAPVKHRHAVSPLANVATVFSPKQAVSQYKDVFLRGEVFKIQATKKCSTFSGNIKQMPSFIYQSLDEKQVITVTLCKH